jgi:hypothetical protein
MSEQSYSESLRLAGILNDEHLAAARAALSRARVLRSTMERLIPNIRGWRRIPLSFPIRLHGRGAGLPDRFRFYLPSSFFSVSAAPAFSGLSSSDLLKLWMAASVSPFMT